MGHSVRFRDEMLARRQLVKIRSLVLQIVTSRSESGYSMKTALCHARSGHLPLLG
jgi:hypothetical protein